MINFLGLGIGSEYQARVKIYDGDRVVFDGMSFDGKVCVKLKCKGYRLKARFLDEIIDTSIYGCGCITLAFNQNPMEAVTLILRDFNYGIPIEKGEIVLWPR